MSRLEKLFTLSSEKLPSLIHQIEDNLLLAIALKNAPEEIASKWLQALPLNRKKIVTEHIEHLFASRQESEIAFMKIAERLPL